MATILIIEDSESQRAEILRALAPMDMFERTLEASDGFQGLKLLLKERVDVVLCDLEMPGLDGEKLLRVKQQCPGGADIPFIFLTASQNFERRARLLEDGASDAVTKPFHPADLVARLRLHMKIKRLQDELREKNETLAHLSTTDAVTGLRTRRYAFDVLSIEFLRARRYEIPLTILMADLDHFKQVNDDYGHPTGDVVLQGVSSLLCSRLRATDLAGRYGGEEIIVILAENGVEGGVALADRWRAAVEAEVFHATDGRRLHVTVSIGVAGFDGSLTSPDQLVAAADEALYRAKQGGRNQVVSAEPV